MTEHTDPVWRDGRLINPSISGMICIHGVGLTPGMWCGGCIDADAPGPAGSVPPACANHRETQHRDGKPPWCNACGWRHATPASTARAESVGVSVTTFTSARPAAQCSPARETPAVLDEETAQRLRDQFAGGRGDAGTVLPPDSGLRSGIVEELRFVPSTLATYAGDRAGPLTHPIVELGSVLRAQLGHPERIRIWIEAAE